MVEGLEGGLHRRDMSHARRRLTVAQAADELGVTVGAIRSRVKRGTIEHVREGGRVYIMLGVDHDATSRDQGTDQDTDQPRRRSSGGRDALIEELRDRVRALEEANRENRRIIAALTSRIPKLEAPQEPRESPESAEPRSGEPASTEPAEGSQEAAQEHISWVALFYNLLAAALVIGFLYLVVVFASYYLFPVTTLVTGIIGVVGTLGAAWLTVYLIRRARWTR